jgi:hypothetical protein
VPSPTFTLMQLYELPRFPVVHADLYRVNTLAELAELGWDEASVDAAVLVEWPERAGPLLQAERLEVHLSLAPDLGPHAPARLPLPDSEAGASGSRGSAPNIPCLESAGFTNARSVHIQGDASTRSYERLYLGTETAILMKSPISKDGPAIRNGRTYGEIAKLAQDVKPFIALSRGLRTRGFSAPEIYAADLSNGLLILEDLGVEGVVSDPPEPIEERYAAAIDVLVALHKQELPHRLPVAPRIEYEIPRYDLDALLIEADLLIDWYIPHCKPGTQIDALRAKTFARSGARRCSIR